MQLKLNRALCATTALATGLLLATGALAQSTATQVQELVVTGARGAPTIQGVITQVQEAKDESIVTHEFFERQQAGQNFAQLINLLPGVNYSSEDATGNLSGDLRIHAFDGNHIGITIDGVPVNDSGNYAIFPGEYLTQEITDHITVNMGATSVDSPTASAVGGSVDVVSKIPTKERSFIVQPTFGSNNFQRYYAEADTGEIGPWGTRSYLALNYDHGSKFVGGGDLMKEGFDARVYQPLKGSDFVSLAASYVVEHNYFYDTSSPAQFDQPQFGIGKNNLDYNSLWVPPTAIAGKVDTPPFGPASSQVINKGSTPGLEQGNDPFGGGLEGNFWGLHPNPVIFGTIRGTSKFSLSDKLTFTFDPSFFYTLANGGGAFATSESDPRLKGNNLASKGVDLNGDGDQLDTVILYGPSNTNTRRYGIVSALLYDLDEHHHFSLAYTFDDAHHRQTGELGYVDPATGLPGSVFGGKDGWGSTKVRTADGSILRTRDRVSVAMLNQVSLNYIGKFMDDRLHINVGIRAPFFKRDLNQLCYSYNGGSVQCDTVDPALVTAALAKDIAAFAAAPANAKPAAATNLNQLLFGKATGINNDLVLGQPAFRMPFKQTYKFDKVLPNAGITYRLTDNQMVYATYAQGFSAPKTDNLYISGTVVVAPETSDSYAAGWRYQTHDVVTSFSVWDVNYKNRIVSSFDPLDPSISIDRNIGEVDIWGLDLEAGAHPFEHLSLYASANYTHSDVKSNEFVSTSGGVAFALPTKGKQLVLTPEKTFSARAQYDFSWMSAGLQVKYSDSRFVDDMNTASLPDFTTLNFDARMPVTLNGLQNSYLQFNIYNLTNTRYPVRTSSITNATPVVFTPTFTLAGKPYFYTYDSPRTFQLTLHAEF
jgi:iron complex outermembrane receptor protein